MNMQPGIKGAQHHRPARETVLSFEISEMYYSLTFGNVKICVQYDSMIILSIKYDYVELDNRLLPLKHS